MHASQVMIPLSPAAIQSTECRASPGQYHLLMQDIGPFNSSGGWRSFSVTFNNLFGSTMPQTITNKIFMSAFAVAVMDNYHVAIPYPPIHIHHAAIVPGTIITASSMLRCLVGQECPGLFWVMLGHRENSLVLRVNFPPALFVICWPTTHQQGLLICSLSYTAFADKSHRSFTRLRSSMMCDHRIPQQCPIGYTSHSRSSRSRTCLSKRCIRLLT